jgi:hypothetical protein
MIETPKARLMSTFDKAIEDNVAVVVVIRTPDDTVYPEIIIHRPYSIPVKKAFYNKAYTDECVHVMNDKVLITNALLVGDDVTLRELYAALSFATDEGHTLNEE